MGSYKSMVDCYKAERGRMILSLEIIQMPLLALFFHQYDV